MKIFSKLNKNKKLKKIKIREITSFYENHIKLLNKVQRYDIITFKDTKYLNWRYCKNPNWEYKIYVAKRNKKTLGYIILKINSNKIKKAIIMDIFTVLDKNVIDLLISTIIEYCKDKVDIIYCNIPKNTIYYKHFKMNGFISTFSLKMPKLVALSIKGENEILTNCKWFVTNSERNDI